ncbi:AIPR family protein, partial [Cronobacter dublinensis]|uniref:AIPR family protein n=1 Tax=Cronobacter dublinensis TaxID=413497 RepID=UPI0018F8708E
DHNGDVIVNVAIQETLNTGKEDFWFLNNGVTIITSKAVLSGKTLTIENPQVVNGLQTSHEIYNYFSSLEEVSEESRNVLVRVICESNAESRDKIIRATNSQTSIPPASLRSADVIHRDIEDFFKANGYFYD